MNPRPVSRLLRRAIWHRSTSEATTTPRCRCFSHTAARSRPQPSGSYKSSFTSSTAVPLSTPGSPWSALLLAGAGVAAFAFTFSQTPAASLDAPTTAQADSADAEDTANDKDYHDPELPRYRLSEIRKHDARSEHPWVVRGDRVYDITEWIPAHPGGQVILRAAGGSIDPYWNIFAIHKTQYVYDILDQYLIGYVHPADLSPNGSPSQEEIEDPFVDDPERHAALITRTVKPRNAETPGDALSAKFLTPNDLFYVRNHMWVPRIDEDPDTHVLTIELYDGSVREYTLGELKSRFPSRRITAALQCSGNRRDHMSKDSGRKANGLPWTAGAISNASWSGVMLADVLADAGFDNAAGISGSSEVRHVHFNAMEAYGASIPIKKAVDPQGDVLLAYEMNGEPLPRDHGFPLRAIVPGHVAARSVKWLNRVVLSDEESTSQWQRRDYKCFGPNETKVDWDAAPAIQELPVQSAITGIKMGGWINDDGLGGKGVQDKSTQPTSATAASSEDVKGLVINNSPAAPRAQRISLTGYAYSGGGRNIIRVDVSTDNGRSWSQAYLLPDCSAGGGGISPCSGNGTWHWKRWRFEGAVPLAAFSDPETKEQDKDQSGTRKNESVASNKGADAGQSEGPPSSRRCTTLLVKATDEVYNTQPESHAATWNIRGNLATAWHRVRVCTDCSPGAVNKP